MYDFLIGLDMGAFKKNEDCSRICFIHISYFILFKSWCDLIIESNIGRPHIVKYYIAR